jgi:hypothetical protein
VAYEHYIRLVYHYRLIKPKLADAVGYTSHLLSGVGPVVKAIGDQRIDPPVLYVHFYTLDIYGLRLIFWLARRRPIIDRTAPKMPKAAVTAAPASEGNASTGTNLSASCKASKHAPKLSKDPQIVKLFKGLFESKSAMMLSLSMIHVIEIVAPFAIWKRGSGCF